MSRLKISFPWLWSALSGQQPASRLDDDFNAVPDGSVTIGGRVLTTSYVLTADDEYSTFVCLPTNNMSLSPPNSVAANYSFSFSNESTTTTTVQLTVAATIDGQAVLNPTFPGNFGSLTGVKGGFAIFDGSTWSVYPKLFMP